MDGYRVHMLSIVCAFQIFYASAIVSIIILALVLVLPRNITNAKSGQLQHLQPQVWSRGRRKWRESSVTWRGVGYWFCRPRLLRHAAIDQRTAAGIKQSGMGEATVDCGRMGCADVGTPSYGGQMTYYYLSAVLLSNPKKVKYIYPPI